MTKAQIDKTKAWIAIIGGSAALATGAMAFGWSRIAAPEINCMIDKKQATLVEAINKVNDNIEFQNFMMMETLGDSVIQRASRKYVFSRRGIER